MSDKLHVSEACGLLLFLNVRLEGWARNKIKQRLQTGCVSVNGILITQHNYQLNIGDLVEIGGAAKVTGGATSHVEILYSDRDLIAINKPAGLLSVGTTKETQQHALAILRKQMSTRSHDAKLWPVHRIDRDTSGVLLFVTSREMREAVMAKWDKAGKTYLAIVEGNPIPAQGSVNEPMRLDDIEYRMHVGAHPDAKPALTHYQTLKATNTRALLQVQIDTGRQHQIRAHLAWLGHPVIGDPRYGTAGVRLGLHALELKIVKPNTTKELIFHTSAPLDFMRLLT